MDIPQVVSGPGAGRAVSPAPFIEALEARIAPATFTVLNLHNGGAGSLRDALTQANAAAGADTIVFRPGLHGSIVLTSALPTITDGLTITGPGAGRLAIDGHNAHQIFTIGNGYDSGTSTAVPTDVMISGLKLTHGRAASGGAVYIDDAGGSVTIQASVITGNRAVGVFDPNGSLSTGLGKGGAIDNENAQLTIQSSLISGNAALGARGLAGSAGSGGGLYGTYGTASGGASGGGIYNGTDGVLVVKASVIARNAALGGNGAAGAKGLDGALGVSGGAGGPGSDNTGGDGSAGNDGGDGGYANGGGIGNLGEVTIQSSTISGNIARGGAGAAGGNGGHGGNGGPAYLYNGMRYPAGAGGSGGDGGAAGAGGAGLGAGISPARKAP